MTNDALRELETWLRSQSEDFGALARSYHTRTGQDSVALLKETERHRRYADALSQLLRERENKQSGQPPAMDTNTVTSITQPTATVG